MGMKEDRENLAVSVIARCERLFTDSQNPYYVVQALAASRHGGFTPPEWALEALLNAVEIAAFKHHRTGERISIDNSLGFRLSRGKTPKEREASRHGAETDAFDLVRTIHSCFDIAIPGACEIVYHAIYYDYARLCEENLWRPHKGELVLSSGITRSQWDDVDKRWREESERYIERLESPDAAKDKMRKCEWWTITHGDLLGYSLEQFIDRFYREGTKHKGRFEQARPDMGKMGDYYEGVVLLTVPENCACKIFLDDDHSPPRAVSAIENLCKRSDFEKFLRTFPSTERFGLK